jgi:hypothetical protein
MPPGTRKPKALTANLIASESVTTAARSQRPFFREKLSAYFPQDRKSLGKIRALRRPSTPHLEGIHNPEFAKRMPHSCGDVQSSNLGLGTGARGRSIRSRSWSRAGFWVTTSFGRASGLGCPSKRRTPSKCGKELGVGYVPFCRCRSVRRTDSSLTTSSSRFAWR